MLSLINRAHLRRHPQRQTVLARTGGAVLGPPRRPIALPKLGRGTAYGPDLGLVLPLPGARQRGGRRKISQFRPPKRTGMGCLARFSNATKKIGKENFSGSMCIQGKFRRICLIWKRKIEKNSVKLYWIDIFLKKNHTSFPFQQTHTIFLGNKDWEDSRTVWVLWSSETGGRTTLTSHASRGRGPRTFGERVRRKEKKGSFRKKF